MFKEEKGIFSLFFLFLFFLFPLGDSLGRKSFLFLPLKKEKRLLILRTFKGFKIPFKGGKGGREGEGGREREGGRGGRIGLRALGEGEGVGVGIEVEVRFKEDEKVEISKSFFFIK